MPLPKNVDKYLSRRYYDHKLPGSYTSVSKLYEVYHFEKRAKYERGVEGSGLFAEYVNLFLKGKQEASGWPSDDMTDEEKRLYVEDYARVEGVKLDPENISYNSGKRATNKL